MLLTSAAAAVQVGVAAEVDAGAAARAVPEQAMVMARAARSSAAGRSCCRSHSRCSPAPVRKRRCSDIPPSNHLSSF